MAKYQNRASKLNNVVQKLLLSIFPALNLMELMILFRVRHNHLKGVNTR